MTPQEALRTASAIALMSGQNGASWRGSKAQPFDEAALAGRLFSMLEKSLEIRHPATPGATRESGDSANDDKGLADAA